MNVLAIDNLNFTVYSSPGERKDILKNISFNAAARTITGITGESGSGKTTLAKIIAGHFAPTKGSVTINAEARNKTSPVQLLFQNTGDILNPYRKIYDVVYEAARLAGAQNPDSEAEKFLTLIRLDTGLWNNRGQQLSGGEQQRAALARLLAVRPAILILDEPFAAQDVESQVNLIALLNNIKRQLDITLICISHNIRILKDLADTILVMREGTIVESGNTREILSEPKHPYTALLLKAENYNLNEEELNKLI